MHKVDAQSISVDAVSGATATSMAVIASVRDALEQAGAFNVAGHPIQIEAGEGRRDIDEDGQRRTAEED